MAVGGKVKGITIEFDGDTTKLGRAMKDVESDARAIDKQLKDVNRSLRFNPKSTELLAQKQTLLKKRIDETKKKLDVLKQAQAKLDDDPSVDKNSQEYMELRREIIKTESQLKHFQKEQRKLGNVKLTALGSQLQDIGGKMKTVGTNMTKYITAPLGLLATGSVAAFKEIDDAYDTMIAKTGATGEEAEKMRQTIDNLATTIPTDFQTAGEAVGEVSTRFGVTGQELEDLSGQFVKFAQLNNTDVSSSIDNVQTAMAAFGMDSSQAGEMLDILNQTAQKTCIDVDSLAQSMVTNSAALHAMGFGAAEAAQFLGQMEVAGVDSSTVMAGLKRALANAAAEGVPLDQALSQLQTSMQNAGSDTDAMNLAMELFGKRSGPAIAEACRNGQLDFNNLGSAAESAAGSVSTTFEETLDPIDKFQTTLNELKQLGAEVGASLLTSLQPILEKIAAAIQKVSEWWQSLSPQMQQVIMIVAGIAAVAGPLIALIGGIISALGSLLIMGPMLMAMLAPLAPIILIIVGVIAAAIAIGVLLYKNWDKIKAAAMKLWKGIKTAFAGIKAAITAPIKTAIAIVKTLIAKLTGIFESLKKKARSAFEAIKGFITKPIETAQKTVRGILEKIKGFFPLSIGKIFKNLKLPHFNWHWKDIVGKLKIPVFDGIDWYAKGGIFDSPTIAGIGEAGPEAVVPLDTLWSKLDRIADASGGSQQVVFNVTVNGTDSPELWAKKFVKQLQLEVRTT